MTTVEWKGPLPPPSTLQGYDDLVEGGAERIFQQFENEATHRRSIEQRNLDEIVRERKVAQWVAAAFAFSALGVAAYALTVGAFTAAAILGGGTIAGVVGAFLWKRSDP